jgi:hypothetical protein
MTLRSGLGFGPNVQSVPLLIGAAFDAANLPLLN